jgi:outer membrane protein assembly factor BamB
MILAFANDCHAKTAHRRRCGETTGSGGAFLIYFLSSLPPPTFVIVPLLRPCAFDEVFMKKPLFAVVFACLLTGPVKSDDWPQFRGPDRNGISKETGLLKEWPKGGPTLAWTFKDAGLGFSSVAVAKGVVYTLGTDKAITTECVFAIDEKSGKELWTAQVGPLYTYKANSYGDGPRSTPTVDGNLLFALGGEGQLVCLDLANKGKELWRTHLVKDLGGVLMQRYGWSESPLVDGDHLICTPGGPNGTLAALDKKTGKVVWRSKGLTESATFSSAIVANLHGVRQYLQTSYDITAGQESGSISGIDAKSGAKLWTGLMFKGTNDGVCSTPIVVGNQVYVSAGFGAGCHLFDINAQWVAKDLYKPAISRKVKNTQGGLVLLDGHIFGHSEAKTWICQDFKTGKLAWDERIDLSCVSGSILAADGALYLYTDDGIAALLAPSTENFKLISSFPIPVKSQIKAARVTSRQAQIWTHPAIANGQLFLRDQENIFAFKITK